MKFTRIGKINVGQDGAIFDGELFRLDAGGNCTVYDVSVVDGVTAPKESFKLDKYELICPHSNAVCFGKERYDKDDKYPLLYTNIYNNYTKSENKEIGVTCVYRIEKVGSGFKSTLVQLIEVGFTEDVELWRATEESHGVRPYGNFVVDCDTGAFWAFVMRNEELGTRYFRFDTPDVHDGELDMRLGVLRAVLKKEDIREMFDGEFIHYMQGAVIHGGRLYSTEGFTAENDDKPGLRIVDLKAHSEEYFCLIDYGIVEEPELIDFSDGVCYYSDWRGGLYTVSFN